MDRPPADQRTSRDGQGGGLARQPLHFMPVREAATVEHLQLRTLYTHWRRAGLRQEQALPARKFVKDRELVRHFPFLLLAELVRTDGQFRLLGAGREARRFWALEAASAAAEAGDRAELLRTIMRHLSANRLAVGFTGVVTVNGALSSFHLLALPLSEGGHDMDAAAIEVAFAPVPPHMVAKFLTRTV